MRKRVDAVIAVGIELTAREVGLLHSLAKPIVGIGGPVDGVAALSINDVSAAAFVTHHLISLGHTSIMHIGGSRQKEMDFRVHSQRLLGFTQAMREAGLRHGDETVRSTDLSIEGGYTAGLALLADPGTRPSAIVAGSDEVAIGIIVAARQLGIQVPEQLSVVGIDGHPLAPMFGLTTLAQYPKSQGTLAVGLVMDELLGAVDPERVWREHPVTLEVRRSTTAPPAQ